MANEVTLTLCIKNDTERREAVHKVSDKMICVSAYMKTGKAPNGEYNPLLDFDINVFTKNAKKPTVLVNDVQLVSGKYITVKGSLSAKQYFVNEKPHTKMVIMAKEIIAAEEIESGIWN